MQLLCSCQGFLVVTMASPGGYSRVKEQGLYDILGPSSLDLKFEGLFTSKTITIEI